MPNLVVVGPRQAVRARNKSRPQTDHKLKTKKIQNGKNTTKLRVIKRSKSTSKAQGYKERYFNQKFLNKCIPKDTPVLNDALFGDAFND